VHPARDDQPEVMELAPLGAGKRLDVERPPPAGVEDLPLDGRLAEVDDIDAAMVEPTDGVRSVEASGLDLGHEGSLPDSEPAD
jgi:hypothetical protein